MAIEHLNRYRVDKAFIGVDGLSLQHGLSANSEKEASISLAAASNASQVYLLCDSSKLEKDKYFRFAPLSIIHILVTDQQAPAELLQQYTRRNVQVLH
jgi:DeoR family fructose operon transcriptional repressor